MKELSDQGSGAEIVVASDDQSFWVGLGLEMVLACISAILRRYLW